jgi:diadenosine tetraphosphate (Ap4A) HIT family hydrolase
VARADAFALDPRLVADTHALGELEFSRVLLMDDARFPWLILVPRRTGLRELTDLAQSEQRILLDEIDRSARALQTLFVPDKLNIAALGNVVAQLHVHVIARFAGDAAWPRPVWGAGARTPYAADAMRECVHALCGALGLARSA